MPQIAEEALIFEALKIEGYEDVLKISEEESGLQAIICIHDTTLGPALGGTRIYPYTSFGEALTDVQRLARGMTYKSAIAETGCGGGKSVIIANQRQKTPQLLRAFGRAVHRLNGRYICAEDVGSTTEDMEIISQETPHVVGLPSIKSSGDPSPFTAWGVFRSIEATFQTIYGGSGSVRGRKIALQGLGNVGSKLLDFLFWGGAELVISDLDPVKAAEFGRRYGATVCPPELIYDVECDLFAPCALGGVINPETVERLQCRAVVGSANNQLLSLDDARRLWEREIVYGPDFVVNSGGLKNVAEEITLRGYQPDKAREQIDNVVPVLHSIFEIAKKNHCSPNEAALSLANYRLKYQVSKRKVPPRYHHLSK
jgi:leucine dehydrogenase